jgi:hypothetical protein
MQPNGLCFYGLPDEVLPKGQRWRSVRIFTWPAQVKLNKKLKCYGAQVLFPPLRHHNPSAIIQM